MEVEPDALKIRIGRNESRFRSANERIATEAASLGVVNSVPFVCECADPACTQIVELGVREYEAVRSSPTAFFCVPGHQELAVRAGAAIVVAEKRHVCLSEQIGIAGRVAAAQHRLELV